MIIDPDEAEAGIINMIYGDTRRWKREWVARHIADIGKIAGRDYLVRDARMALRRLLNGDTR